MAKSKLSDEEKRKRRRESNQKYNAKRRPQDTIIGLDQHPNAFANLATPELREQYSQELEDGLVAQKIRSTVEHDIEYNPDEDFRDFKFDDDEEKSGDWFDGNKATNEPLIEPMEGHSPSLAIVDHANSPSLPSSPPSIDPPRSFASSNIHFIQSILINQLSRRTTTYHLGSHVPLFPLVKVNSY